MDFQWVPLTDAIGQSDDRRSWSARSGGKSPSNTKPSGLLHTEVQVGMSNHLTWEREEFYTVFWSHAVLWWKASEMSLELFRGLSWFVTPSKTRQLPVRSVEGRRRVGLVCKGGQFGMIKNTILSPQDLPLSTSKAQSVDSGSDMFSPSFLCRPEICHHTPKTSCPSP